MKRREPPGSCAIHKGLGFIKRSAKPTEDRLARIWRHSKIIDQSGVAFKAPRSAVDARVLKLAIVRVLQHYRRIL